MKLVRAIRASMLLVVAACGDGDGSAAIPRGARIQTQLVAAGGSTASRDKFRGGAATLESLRYYITTIMICESLEVQGSGFNNPQGCVELYKRDIGGLAYSVTEDWRRLGDIARSSDEGFVELIGSRSALASQTLLTQDNAHAYNYGIINWALPVKVRASVPFLDGTTLYTHDGVSSFETVGVDNYRSYFTAPSTPLDQAPAQDSVVILGNGGNWFKFQTPLTISADDVEQKREFVLDLVFNPQGIVNGYAGAGMGNISQRDSSGTHVFDITVPMLDLAPVPHRADQRVVRESYRGATSVDGNSFDVRIELYSVDGETSVYGADMKTLVNNGSTSVPPSIAKASFVESASDGSLSFSSWKHTPVVTGLVRAASVGGSTRVSLVCAEHSNRAAVEGGSAIAVEHCPSAAIGVDLTLVSRNFVEGSVPTAVGAGPSDAGVDAALSGG